MDNFVKPEIPYNEANRLDALRKFNILDSQREIKFDHIVWLASYICKTPISLISLVDKNRQWFKASIGLDVKETSREISFCGHAINEDTFFIVNDTLTDKRFRENPLVINDPKIRFYAATQLQTWAGYNIGTLCVIDHKPSTLSEEQKKALSILSSHVINMIEINSRLQEISKKEKNINSTELFLDIFHKAVDQSQNGIKIINTLDTTNPVIYQNTKQSKIDMQELSEAFGKRYLESNKTTSDEPQQIHTTNLDSFHDKTSHSLSKAINYNGYKILETIDLTEINQLQNEVQTLKNQINRLQSDFLRTIADEGLGYIVTDNQGKIAFANHEAELIVGQKLVNMQEQQWDNIPLLNELSTKLVNKDIQMHISLHSSAPKKRTFYLIRNNSSFTKGALQGKNFWDATYKSSNMRNMFIELTRCAQNDAHIFLETDAGGFQKDTAQTIHRLSNRSEKPFLTIDCSSLSQSAFLRSRLYGHTRGYSEHALCDLSGVLELAHGGIVFLENCLQLPFEMHAELIQAIRDQQITKLGEIKPRSIDCRVIFGCSSPTNRNSLQEIFLSSLYDSIPGKYFKISPLRTHREDIPFLADFFLAQINEKLHKKIKYFSTHVIQIFLRYDWPENMKELHEEVLQAVMNSKADFVAYEDLSEKLKQYSKLNKISLQSEAPIVSEIMNQTGNDALMTAHVLGISRATLFRKLAKEKKQKAE